MPTAASAPVCLEAPYTLLIPLTRKIISAVLLRNFLNFLRPYVRNFILVPSTYIFADLLEMFPKIYRTIDVRTALIRHDNAWFLVAASVNLRIATDDMARQEFQKKIKRFPSLRSDRFDVLQHCYPPEHLRELAVQIEQGKFPCDAHQVLLTMPRNIMAMPLNPRSPSDLAQSEVWPYLDQMTQITADGTVDRAFREDSVLQRKAELAGYDGPHLVIKELLDVDFGSSSSCGYLWLRADIPIRLRQPIAHIMGEAVKLFLEVEAEPAIPDVSCAVRVNSSGLSIQTLPPSVCELSSSSKVDSRQLWAGQIELNVERNRHITVDVLCYKAGRLYS